MVRSLEFDCVESYVMISSIRFITVSRHWKDFNYIIYKSAKLFSSAVVCSALNMKKEKVLKAIKQAIPPLLESKYKGQAGRIGVIGGSKE